MPADIYIHPAVAAVRELHAPVLERAGERIHQRLNALADNLWQAWQNGDPVVYTELANHHPEMKGWSPEQLGQVKPTEETCRLTIAREHGYADWPAAAADKKALDTIFEKALQALLHGQADTLRALLKQYPALARQRSDYAHRATLLHYLAANGVEIYHQMVPSNAPEMLDLLLTAGADPAATMPVYGGQYNFRQLLESSAHPQAAGLTGPLLQRLEKD